MRISWNEFDENASTYTGFNVGLNCMLCVWCCDVQCYADTEQKMNSICRHLDGYSIQVYFGIFCIQNYYYFKIWDNDDHDVDDDNLVDCRKHYKSKWFEMEQKWLKISVYFLVFPERIKNERAQNHEQILGVCVCVWM